MTRAGEPRNITIVGAGLAGPLLSVFLARQGHNVTLYERRPDPRIAGFSGGRSINLALSARGIDALRRVGLTEDVLKTVIPMRGRMLHEPDGSIAFQYYSSNHTDAINSVSRATLNRVLLDATEKHANAKIVFDHRCTACDLAKPSVTFEAGADSREVTVEADLVVGTDGAFSAVRQAMNKLDRFDFSQSYLEHGYKELTIPPTAAGDFAMEPNALHIWPRGAFMMIALPNQDRSFTCTCFWPFSGPPGFDALKTPEQIRSFFKERFSDAVPLMPTLVQDFQANPTSSLVTMRCWPWVYRDKAALLGDAAHAIVPFYGQGMNAAFEDCVVLAECAERSGSSWCKALAEYQSRRKPNTDAIADMALENFIEMRDHVASRTFLLKKKLGHAMHRLFPRAFVPLYNMVSFSTIPYAEARKRADLQSKIVRGLGIGLLAIVILLILALVSRRAR